MEPIPRDFHGATKEVEDRHAMGREELEGIEKDIAYLRSDAVPDIMAIRRAAIRFTLCGRISEDV